jgi:sialidase-1
MRGLPAYGVARRSNSLGVLRQRDAGGSSSSPLLTDLAAYWKLDDLTWSDSVGSNNLTNNGGVTVGTPKLGAGSAEFGSGNQKLSSTSNALDIGTSDFAISLWLNTTTVDANNVFLSHGVFNEPGYYLQFEGSAPVGRVKVAFNGGSSGLSLAAISPSTPSAYDDGLWHHFVFNFDRDGNLEVYADGSGTPVITDDISDRAGDMSPTQPFLLGGYDTVASTANLYQGKLDEGGIWKRVLTLSEISDLYNSGSGLSYPF